MWYHLILVFVLHQQLRYFHPYYQYAQISSKKLITVFLELPSLNKNSERESNHMP